MPCFNNIDGSKSRSPNKNKSRSIDRHKSPKKVNFGKQDDIVEHRLKSPGKQKPVLKRGWIHELVYKDLMVLDEDGSKKAGFGQSLESIHITNED